ncbi:unnamed protein product [Rotaria sordida]|uniref:Uncharacterized protein n=1 Tax=Rotaria sordida TaxID=392033 RepID=A0A813PZX7_9BILA|nr:unnamed protein product [Rotaria sordida]CAF0760744.1 unnamed protein product [Rotaria sordida]
MSLTTSPIMSRIIQTSRNQNDYNQVMIINPNETINYEPYANYQTPRTTYRTYQQPSKPKYQYTIEQESKSYRCCQWCRYWCTRKCPSCHFCDRIVACPLLFFILSALFLLLLLTALLTLFGLHPNINSARRYYGIISALSIVNRTKYIYNLDRICSRINASNNCLDITTSTGINIVATTIIINRTIITMNYSYILLVNNSLKYLLDNFILKIFDYCLHI